MRMFGSKGRSGTGETAHGPAPEGTGPGWFTRAKDTTPRDESSGTARPDAPRSEAARYIEDAGERASRAAETGHTWTSRSPARPSSEQPAVSEPAPAAGSGANPATAEAAYDAALEARKALRAFAGAAAARNSRSAEGGGAAAQSPARGVSSALARHTDETFAARGRLAARKPISGQPTSQKRRRIWDIEDDPRAERGSAPLAARSAAPPSAPPASFHRAEPEPRRPGLRESAAPWHGDDRAHDHGAPDEHAYNDRAYDDSAPDQGPPDYDAAGADAPDDHGRAPAGDWLDRIRRPSEPRTVARPTAPDPEVGADDVATARAQLARMAELGIDGEAQPGPGNRAKTRVLGFRQPELADDPFDRAHGSGAPNRGPDFPVGWLVVTDGPGRGASFALTSGVATIGRSDDQTVRLDFGDTAISRSAHASIAFDDETRRFFLGAGPKANLVRRNDRPVLATEELADGDTIRLGETTLRLAALCGDGFAWDGPRESA